MMNDNIGNPPPIEVREDAARQGRGVFATRALEKGERLGFFNGAETARRSRMSLQFGDALFVEPDLEEPLRHLNHACAPSAVFRGRALFAARDLNVGEAVTIDYNAHETELSEPFDCSCGTPACPGKIRGWNSLSAEQRFSKTQAGGWLRGPLEVVARMRWRRLDVPGRDRCRLLKFGSGHALVGLALYEIDGEAVRLSYRVFCAEDWSTPSGRVRGFVGARRVEWSLEKGDGNWRVNGVEAEGVPARLDLDYSFTPATNLPQLRRAALARGESAQVPVAWFEEGAWKLSVLPQRYERIEDDAYAYEAPTQAYAGTLRLAANGFARIYPRLWEAA